MGNLSPKTLRSKQLEQLIPPASNVFITANIVGHRGQRLIQPSPPFLIRGDVCH